MSKTIQQLATEANGFLYRDAETKRVLRKDDAPEWVQSLCMSAHGEMMPDDWRYEFIQDALSALEDDEDAEPDVDSLYPYNSDRYNWLASNVHRAGYCDEAMEDRGGEFTSISDTIAVGMDAELREVFDLVRQSLEERAEELAGDELEAKEE